MTRRNKESQPMPNKDPGIWQAVIEHLPWFLVSALTFCVAFARGVHDGGPWKKALLGAVVCTLLAVGLYPVFLWLAESRGWPGDVAVAPCVFLGFLGTEWIRNKADDLYEVLIGLLKK